MGETMRRQAMVIATALLMAGTAMAATQDAGEAAAVHPILWPAAKSPAAISYAATEARIDALIKKMTLDPKVGQLIQADISTITPKDREPCPPGPTLPGAHTRHNGNKKSHP